MKEGWEYKKLGEIAIDMYRGAGIRREQITASGYPCVRYGEIYTTYNIAFENCISHTVEDNISPRKYFEYGDLLFAITGESVEDIGKTIAYLGHEKCLLGGDIVCMKHNENPKYLSYALSSREAIRQKGLGKTKLKVVHTNIPSLKEIIIPVPPLSEQQSIVDYLDSAFAKIDAMKANAEKALNEAKALFQTSLKEMLEPKEGWEEKTLPDISENLDSIRIPVTKINRTEGKYPYYGASGIVDYVNDYLFDEDILLISEDGANLLMRTYPIAFSVSGKVWVNNHAHVLRFKDMATQKFVEYFFAGFKLDEYITGAAQPKLTQKALNIIPIYLPNEVSDQQTIVTTLDSLKSKVDHLQANFDKISQECDALKQAILRQVFE